MKISKRYKNIDSFVSCRRIPYYPPRTLPLTRQNSVPPPYSESQYLFLVLCVVNTTLARFYDNTFNDTNRIIICYENRTFSK